VVEDNISLDPLVDKQHKETVVDSVLNDPEKRLRKLDPTPSGKDTGGGGH